MSPRKELPVICPACGSQDTVVKMTDKVAGLYCSNCGKRIRTVTRQKMLNADNRRIVNKAGDSCATKRIRKYGMNTIVDCDICGCILHSSRFPRPEGQFDLINASYCPVCGNEFPDEQKILRKTVKYY